MNLKSLVDYWNKFCYILTKPQKRWGVILMVMTLGGAIVETLGVSVILPLVQVMLEPDELRKFDTVNKILTVLHIDTNTKFIWFVGAFVIFIYIFKNMYLLFLSYVRAKYACKVQRELSVEMMESYMKRGYMFFLNTGTGELLRGMSESIAHTYQALYQSLKILAEILTVFCICVYIMMTDIVMALVVALLASFCLVVVVMGFRKWAKRSGEINYHYTAIINKILLQTFQGIKEVLVMQRQHFFIDSFQENYIKKQRGIIGQNLSAESPTYLIEGMCVTGLILAVCFKTSNSINAATFVPQLASFAVAAFRILPSLGRISMHFNQFVFCIPGVNDTYNNFREVRGELYEVINTKKKANIGKIKFEQNLQLKNISWRYPDNDRDVLSNININIRRGESVAFIGTSGAGKTTLSDIILGLLVPENGDILIDGISIYNFQEEWCRIIGFVPQNAFLMDDTIRNNVAFGISQDDIDDIQIWTALEQAQLKTFVEELPQGLDTVIGERGIRFSGGQRQRVVIARALYHNPDILILDEATSALDTETETAVMEAIENLQGKKTLIIIAHRLTTIKHCNTIYKIKDGKAVKCKYEDLV